MLDKKLNKSYTELKKAVRSTSKWIESHILDKFEDNYKKLITQTDDVIAKIADLKDKIVDESKIKWWDLWEVIKKKNEDYKEEIIELYWNLKTLVWEMNIRLREKKKKWIVVSMKEEYKKAEEETKKLMKKIGELKTDLIDDKYIEVNYNWTNIPVTFDIELGSLDIWTDKYKVDDICINKKIRDEEIKIKSFSIKKEKPIMSIFVPSLVAEKYSLWSNHSKPYILEWVVKRDKIAEMAEWLLLYWKGELKIEINGTKVHIKMNKMKEDTV